MPCRFHRYRSWLNEFCPLFNRGGSPLNSSIGWFHSLSSQYNTMRWSSLNSLLLVLLASVAFDGILALPLPDTDVLYPRAPAPPRRPPPPSGTPPQSTFLIPSTMSFLTYLAFQRALKRLLSNNLQVRFSFPFNHALLTHLAFQRALGRLHRVLFSFPLDHVFL